MSTNEIGEACGRAVVVANKEHPEDVVFLADTVPNSSSPIWVRLLFHAHVFGTTVQAQDCVEKLVRAGVFDADDGAHIEYMRVDTFTVWCTHRMLGDPEWVRTRLQAAINAVVEVDENSLGEEGKLALDTVKCLLEAAYDESKGLTPF